MHGGGHAHTHTHIPMLQTKGISRNQARACFKKENKDHEKVAHKQGIAMWIMKTCNTTKLEIPILIVVKCLHDKNWDFRNDSINWLHHLYHV